MPVVWIPPLLRDLTGGEGKVTVPGETIRQVNESLDECYPGFRERMYVEDRLRPDISVVVDVKVSQQRLRHRLKEASEVHFLPAISGGGTKNHFQEWF